MLLKQPSETQWVKNKQKNLLSQRMKSSIKKIRGQPGGTVLEFAHSALAAQGLAVWILSADMAVLGKPCCGRHPTYKIEEDGHGC